MTTSIADDFKSYEFHVRLKFIKTFKGHKKSDIIDINLLIRHKPKFSFPDYRYTLVGDGQEIKVTKDLWDCVEVSEMSIQDYWIFLQLSRNLTLDVFNVMSKSTSQPSLFSINNKYSDQDGTEQYVNGILNNIKPKELLDNRTNTISCSIYDDPIPNATITSNGTIHISSGLLAAINNLSFLYVVLFHEIVHYVLGHYEEEEELIKDQKLIRKRTSMFLNVVQKGVTFMIKGQIAKDCFRELSPTGIMIIKYLQEKSHYRAIQKLRSTQELDADATSELLSAINGIDKNYIAALRTIIPNKYIKELRDQSYLELSENDYVKKISPLTIDIARRHWDREPHWVRLHLQNLIKGGILSNEILILSSMCNILACDNENSIEAFLNELQQKEKQCDSIDPIKVDKVICIAYSMIKQFDLAEDKLEKMRNYINDKREEFISTDDDYIQKIRNLEEHSVWIKNAEKLLKEKQRIYYNFKY